MFIVIGLELPFKSKYYPDEIAYEKFMFNIPLKNAKYPALNRIFMQISKRIRKNLLLEKWEIILKSLLILFTRYQPLSFQDYSIIHPSHFIKNNQWIGEGERRREVDMKNTGKIQSHYLCAFVFLITIISLVSTVNAASITVTSPNGGESWEWDRDKQSPGASRVSVKTNL